MLAAVFGAYYLYSVSYSAAILCVTVLLGMVYGSLNAPLGPLLVLRFEETAIGVLAAGLAASFVWPIPTRHQVRHPGSRRRAPFKTSCEPVWRRWIATRMLRRSRRRHGSTGRSAIFGCR
jgi:hypothetical protein